MLLLDEDNDDFLLFDFDDDGDEDMDFVVVDAGVLGFIIFCKLNIHTRIHARFIHLILTQKNKEPRKRMHQFNNN